MHDQRKLLLAPRFYLIVVATHMERHHDLEAGSSNRKGAKIGYRDRRSGKRGAVARGISMALDDSMARSPSSFCR